MKNQSILSSITNVGDMRSDVKELMSRLSGIKDPREKRRVFLDGLERKYLARCYESISLDRKRRTDYEKKISDLNRKIKKLESKKSQQDLFES